MENLLLFFKRFGLLLQFLLLETVAILLLISFGGYQRSQLMSSASVLVGTLYEGVDAVTGYFHLDEVNRQLSAENAALKNQLSLLQETAHQPMPLADSSMWVPYQYVSAQIVQHSVNKAQNYITINKGSLAGIAPDMGVVSPQGVVGIVKSVSAHYATVMPIINVQSRISCRLDSTRNIGSLVWDTADYRYALLQEVPGHVQVKYGETLSTSGFSAIFPAGIPVGTVVDYELLDESQFLEIKVALAVDFAKIDQVHVIRFAGADEVKSLQ